MGVTLCSFRGMRVMLFSCIGMGVTLCSLRGMRVMLFSCIGMGVKILVESNRNDIGLV